MINNDIITIIVITIPTMCCNKSEIRIHIIKILKVSKHVPLDLDILFFFVYIILFAIIL